MTSGFVLCIFFAGIFMVIAMLSAITATDNEGKSLAPVTCIMIVITAIFTALAFYNAGQANKTLPDLKPHGCTISGIHLNYPLGSKYQQDVQKLVSILGGNAKCTGTITVQYPANPPIPIPLK